MLFESEPGVYVSDLLKPNVTRFGNTNDLNVGVPGAAAVHHRCKTARAIAGQSAQPEAVCLRTDAECALPNESAPPDKEALYHRSWRLALAWLST